MASARAASAAPLDAPGAPAPGAPAPAPGAAAAAAADEEAVGRLFEDLRRIAAEARGVIARLYGAGPGGELEAFTDALTPAFQPILATLQKYRGPATGGGGSSGRPPA